MACRQPRISLTHSKQMVHCYFSIFEEQQVLQQAAQAWFSRRFKNHWRLPACISMRIINLLLLPLLTTMLAYAKLAVVFGKVIREVSTLKFVQYITCNIIRLMVHTCGECHGGVSMRYGAGAEERIFYYVSCIIYSVCESVKLMIVVYNTRPPWWRT